MSRHREQEREAPRKAWLGGHSLGGYLSLLAALKRPQWVKDVVMLDSPVIAGWKSGLLRFTQWTGLDERLSPAAATKKRRMHWTEPRRGVAAFPLEGGVRALGRAHVVRLHRLCDSIESSDAGDARTLAFKREVEYLIYRTLPRTLGARTAHGVPVPVGFLAGTHSREVRHVGLDMTWRIVGDHFEWMDGSHLFPMGRPIETAHAERAGGAARGNVWNRMI